jgi:hypothetical protein
MELSKSDKKVARAILEKGMQQEFLQGMERAEELLKAWRNGTDLAPFSAQTKEDFKTFLKIYDRTDDEDEK